MAKRRGGGYYLDVGASQLLIDGNIKLKSGSAIKRFTKTGLEFEDGSTVDADVIMFATGCVFFFVLHGCPLALASPPPSLPLHVNSCILSSFSRFILLRPAVGDGQEHPDVVARVKQMWGLDEEGELRNVWRDTGVPNFWFMMGNLMWCRFHSKHLALQIKAIEESVLPGSGSEHRYQ